jgi:hypothetical protein
MVSGETPLPVVDLPPVGPSPGQKAWRLLRPALWIAAIPVALLLLIPVLIVALVTKLFDRPLERTREEVAEILEARLVLDGDWPAWDAFISIPIADPELDAIRRECLDLDRFSRRPSPPRLDTEVIAKIERYIETLGSRRGTEAAIFNGLARFGSERRPDQVKTAAFGLQAPASAPRGQGHPDPPVLVDQEHSSPDSKPSKKIGISSL